MSTSRPRVDARRSSAPNRGPAAAADNRRALIAAARAVYAEQGPAVPFSAIAKRAGVGQGTLYRHFPDRVALVLAVFDENVDALEEALREDGTIMTLLDRVIDQASVSTAFIRLLSEHQHDPRARELALRLDRLVDLLRERDQTAGRIGTHVQTLDVQIAISMLAHELASTPESDRATVAARARRLFELAFRSA
ncbi:TetR/AcrR family transcriptional regulator [Microbacterium sp. JZ31]|uniref:TetR/AcrR family transcriptional regulator n=1 Tax=Microbacterium sp. JZ31 TaxID=1906274 RepID=UPI001933507F|nr:TetR/AcrR family transcriptional regulator [Microbacterium sp. JZ31]